jgi:hypothetical protein
LLRFAAAELEAVGRICMEMRDNVLNPGAMPHCSNFLQIIQKVVVAKK